MKPAFNDFINQIPMDVYNNTEKHDSANIIVFRPSSYIVNRELYLNDYHFALLTSNPPPMMIEKKLHHFGKKRMLVLTPDTKTQCTEYVPARPFIAMNIKKDFFLEIGRQATGKRETGFSNVDYSYSPKLLNLISAFEEESKEKNASNQLMLQSISMQIVIQILRETGNDDSIDYKKQYIDKNYVNLAKEYMTTYYNANIKIDDICQQIHLSPYYFIRMFKEKTGQSPHDYLQSIRLDKAEEMLKKGNYSIEEVARLNGFVNASHFSTLFKRVKGVTPSRYRKTFFIIKK